MQTNRVLLGGNGLCDWRVRLAQPELHWKRGASAFETAVSWELAQRTASGIPPDVGRVLGRGPSTEGAIALVVVPEHKVGIPGKGKPSQNDVWVLARNRRGLISMAVEGKAGEPFDDTIGKWLDVQEKANRKARLTGLCERLGSGEPGSDLRYQLFHRAASAVIEAERCGAAVAMLMVQGFKPRAGITDVQAFCDYLGASPISDDLYHVPSCRDAELFIGWTLCEPASDADIARVAT